jgi:hypothetical protein
VLSSLAVPLTLPELRFAHSARSIARAPQACVGRDVAWRELSTPKSMICPRTPVASRGRDPRDALTELEAMRHVVDSRKRTAELRGDFCRRRRFVKPANDIQFLFGPGPSLK